MPSTLARALYGRGHQRTVTRTCPLRSRVWARAQTRTPTALLTHLPLDTALPLTLDTALPLTASDRRSDTALSPTDSKGEYSIRASIREEEDTCVTSTR